MVLNCFDLIEPYSGNSDLSIYFEVLELKAEHSAFKKVCLNIGHDFDYTPSC